MGASSNSKKRIGLFGLLTLIFFITFLLAALIVLIMYFSSKWGVELGAMPYVIVLMFFAITPVIIDITLAYRSVKKTQKLIAKISPFKKDKNTDSQEDKNQANIDLTDWCNFLKSDLKGLTIPAGTPYLTRGTIALSIIMLVGITTFYLLVNGDNGQIINNIISMLGSLLSAVVGFYFGGRAVTTSSTDKPNTPTK